MAPKAGGSTCAAVTPISPLTGQTTTLYDGALNPPSNPATPDGQGFNYAAIGSASQTFDGAAGLTTLDTTLASTNTYAGYSTKTTGIVPTLNHTTGFSVRFQLQLVSESHNNNDRAGLSVIVLDKDSKGVELGFWPNEIWAQNDPSTGTIFTHGEGVAFDTTAGLVNYDLTFIGNYYYLFANGNLILNQCPVRDYTSYTGIGAMVYKSQNFIFLGDDTTSAQASFKFASASIVIPAISLQVSNSSDNGLGYTPGTLSYALTQASSGQTISFASNLTSVILQGGSLPPAKAGVTIVGRCIANPSGISGKPAITINGNGRPGPGLTLSGNNTVSGLKITGFANAPQLKVASGSLRNHLTCLVASK